MYDTFLSRWSQRIYLTAPRILYDGLFPHLVLSSFGMFGLTESEWHLIKGTRGLCLRAEAWRRVGWVFVKGLVLMGSLPDSTYAKRPPVVKNSRGPEEINHQGHLFWNCHRVDPKQPGTQLHYTLGRNQVPTIGFRVLTLKTDLANWRLQILLTFARNLFRLNTKLVHRRHIACDFVYHL